MKSIFSKFMLLALFLAGSIFVMAEGTTATISTFPTSSTDGSIDDKISYKEEKGVGASNDPVAYATKRIYPKNLLILEATPDAVITEIILTYESQKYRSVIQSFMVGKRASNISSTDVSDSTTTTIRFSFEATDAYKFFSLTPDAQVRITSISVTYELVTCDNPTALLTANVTDNSVDLSWTAPATAVEDVTEYAVHIWGGDDFHKYDTNTTVSRTISGLPFSTELSWSVTTICGEGFASETENGTAFTTLEEPPVLTYLRGMRKYQIFEQQSLAASNLSFLAENLNSDLSIAVVGTGVATPVFEVDQTTIDYQSGLTDGEFTLALTTGTMNSVAEHIDTLKISDAANLLLAVVLKLEVLDATQLMLSITAPSSNEALTVEDVETTYEFTNLDEPGRIKAVLTPSEGDAITKYTALDGSSTDVSITFEALPTDSYTLEAFVVGTDNETVAATAPEVEFMVELGDLESENISLTTTPSTPTLADDTYRDSVVVHLAVSSDITGYENAKIYYTTDGTDANTESTLYDAEEGIHLVGKGSHSLNYYVKVKNYNPYLSTASYDVEHLYTNKVKFSIPGGTYMNPQQISLSCLTADASIRYTTNGETPTATSTLYSGNPINISEDTTIKALAFADGYVSSNDSIVVANYSFVTITPATLPVNFSTDNGKSSLLAADGWFESGLGSDYGSSPKLKFDGTGDLLVLHFDEIPGELSYITKWNQSNNSGFLNEFVVETSEDGISYSSLKTYNATTNTLTSGTTNNDTITNIPSDARYIRWRYVEKGNGNIALGGISLIERSCDNPTSLSKTPASTEADITWTSNASAFSFRYATSKDALATAKDSSLLAASIKLTELSAETKYYFQVKAVCGVDFESDWVLDSLSTLGATDPALLISAPLNGTTLTSSAVDFEFEVNNFDLGTDGKIKLSVGSYDTLFIEDECQLILTSGEYEATASLVDMSGNPLSPAVTVTRSFTVDLEDVATPTFDPEATSSTEPILVTISCATTDAAIYYTTDGSTPTNESTLYTTAIEITEVTTLKAIAYKAGMDSSAVATAVYTVKLSPVPDGANELFVELFDKFTKGTPNGSADGKDVTDSLDLFTTQAGWTGSKIYQAGGAAKMGGSSSLGYIQLPDLDLSEVEGDVFLYFNAMAWLNDNTFLKLIVNGEIFDSVSPLNNTAAYEFATFTCRLPASLKTTATSIRFEGAAASKGRFFLDDIYVYEVPLSTVPVITLPTTEARINTIEGVAKATNVSVWGQLLTENVSVSSNNTAFTLSSTSLNKDEVLSEDGAVLTITYNGEKLLDTAIVTLASTDTSATIKVYASAEAVTTVADLAALRAGESGGLYKVSGAIVLSAKTKNRNQKWFQDANAGILIDDASGVVKTNYNVGDEVSNIIGRLNLYSGLLQFVPLADFGAPTATGKSITPITVSFGDLYENVSNYESRLVRVSDVEFSVADTGNFAASKNYTISNGDTVITFRTSITDADYIGTAIPAEPKDIVGLVGNYNGSPQLTARSLADITEVDTTATCAAPTALSVSGLTSTTATLLWYGTAETFEILLSYTSNGEVLDSTIEVKDTYCNLSGLQATTKYTWKVRSICDETTVSRYSTENEFITSSVANQQGEELNVNLYPNPSTGMVTIEVPSLVKMEIYHVTGRLLRSEMISGLTVVALETSGVYFVKITNAEGISTTQKLIINK